MVGVTRPRPLASVPTPAREGCVRPDRAQNCTSRLYRRAVALEASNRAAIGPGGA